MTIAELSRLSLGIVKFPATMTERSQCGRRRSTFQNLTENQNLIQMRKGSAENEHKEETVSRDHAKKHAVVHWENGTGQTAKGGNRVQRSVSEPSVTSSGGLATPKTSDVSFHGGLSPIASSRSTSLNRPARGSQRHGDRRRELSSQSTKDNTLSHTPRKHESPKLSPQQQSKDFSQRITSHLSLLTSHQPSSDFMDGKKNMSSRRQESSKISPEHSEDASGDDTSFSTKNKSPRRSRRHMSPILPPNDSPDALKDVASSSCTLKSPRRPRRHMSPPDSEDALEDDVSPKSSRRPRRHMSSILDSENALGEDASSSTNKTPQRFRTPPEISRDALRHATAACFSSGHSFQTSSATKESMSPRSSRHESSQFSSRQLKDTSRRTAPSSSRAHMLSPQPSSDLVDTKESVSPSSSRSSSQQSREHATPSSSPPRRMTSRGKKM